MLGVGVATAEPPVSVVYQIAVAPGTIPEAVKGVRVVPSQKIRAVVVGAGGIGFTVTFIGVLAPSHPLVVIWLA